jgi:formylglycine-generating enzyme required for sulfatase activity
MRKRSALLAVALLFTVFILIPNLQAQPLITIDWVTVGDPGNAADDTTTYGAVADSFRIMKFEFQNSQYAAFLNSVDPNGTNPNSVYSADMGSNPLGGISFTSDNASGSKYAIRTDMGDKPVNYVSWFDAARVANWLQNGQGSGSTETGAYTLNGTTSGNAPAVNSGATFYIPTEDQWYKAAYYKGGSANAGYWDYATQSDAAPTPVTANETGIGSAGSTGNFGNWGVAADWNGQDGNVTTVGSNGEASAYGAFDMSGNVSEWNDQDGLDSALRGVRGGCWAHGSDSLSSSYGFTDAPTTENSFRGFRFASVPEPSTYALLLMTAAGALWMTRRRR